MDHKTINLIPKPSKNFENVIVQQIGANRRVPILPKPPLLDEPKSMPSLSFGIETKLALQNVNLIEQQNVVSSSTVENRIHFNNDMNKSNNSGSGQGLMMKNSSIMMNSPGTSSGQNLIKILPKLPVKSIQRSSNGNLLFQGPNNKILSLQIKSNASSTTTTTSSTTSASSTPAITSTVNVTINSSKSNLPTVQNLPTLNVGRQMATLLPNANKTIPLPMNCKTIQYAPLPTNSITSTTTSGMKVTSQTIVPPTININSQNVVVRPNIVALPSTSKIPTSMTSNSIRNPILISHPYKSLPSTVLTPCSTNNTIGVVTPTTTSIQITADSNLDKTAKSEIKRLVKVQPILTVQSENKSSDLSSNQNVSSEDNSIPTSTVITGIPSKKLVLSHMKQISSNITISKSAANIKNIRVEEPSASITLIEKKNTIGNTSTISSAPINTAVQIVAANKTDAQPPILLNSLLCNTSGSHMKKISLVDSSKSDLKFLLTCDKKLQPNLSNNGDSNNFSVTAKLPVLNQANLINNQPKKIKIDNITPLSGVIDNCAANIVNTPNTTISTTTTANNDSLLETIKLFDKIQTIVMAPSDSTTINNEAKTILEESVENKIIPTSNLVQKSQQGIQENVQQGIDIKVSKFVNNSNDIRHNNRIIKICGITPIKVKVNKQQSLLKNKTLDSLKLSPRTTGRSKSLSFQRKRTRKARRLSTCSESQVGNLTPDIKMDDLLKQQNISPKNAETVLKTADEQNQSNTENILLNDNLENALLCEEKIEISPKNNSAELANKNSINNINTNSNSNTPQHSKMPSEQQIRELPTLLPFQQIEQIQAELNRSSPAFTNPMGTLNIKKNNTNVNEIANILKWKNGIGLTKDSSIAFRINELGLLELYEKNVRRNRLDICYEKPIYQRDSLSQNINDYADPIYFCKGCNCHGTPIDFLAPDYCSHECIHRYDKRKSNKFQNIHQLYEHQQQQKKLRKQKMSALLSDSSLPPQNIFNLTKRIFSWTTYLNASKAEPAPIDLFLNPFPCGPNLFQVDMKLEAIDPEYSSLFCVCTIVEIKGYRLKIHFDGYPHMYDFWINADSMDIFPPGWCAKTNRILQPPKHLNQDTFNWSSYLLDTKTIPAPRNLFTHLNSSSNTNPFKVGMRFEADDLRNTRKVCVASVADVLDNRILVHFDGWDDRYDYWVDCGSPYIHPVNWHQRNNFEIVPPPDWIGLFNWQNYIVTTGGIPATDQYFQTRDPIAFKTGMKLEIVDKKNPSLIRPGTVIMTDEYEIKVIFDGWLSEYAFWVVDDNPDIHPIGWCETTNHELESPPGFEGLPAVTSCLFPGCRGIGNAKIFDMDFHDKGDNCPYSLANWSLEIEKPERLQYSEIVTSHTAFKNKRKHHGYYSLDASPSKQRKLNISDLSNRPDVNQSATLLNPATLLVLKQQQHQQQLQQQLQQQQYQVLPLPHNLTIKIEQSSPDTSQNEQLVQILDPKIQIAKHLLCDYGPRLEQNYKLWLKYAEQISESLEKITKNPLEWTVDEVVIFISKIPQCKLIAEIFHKEDIDGEALLSMRQNDLTDLLKLKLGTAIKIYHQIVLLRADVINRFS